MIILVAIYILVLIIWAVLSYFPLRDLYEYGFVGDATMRAERIYIITSAIIIILGFLGIILA